MLFWGDSCLHILFVFEAFYEYIRYMTASMKRTLHADVDEIPTSFVMTNIQGVINKVSGGRWYLKENNKRQKQLFERLHERQYDVIFVLVGRFLYIPAFQEFLNTHSKAYKILYLWDDVQRVASFPGIKDIFDVVYSFDRKDCIRYGFRFLPLFYVDNYIYDGREKKIDMYSVGGLHSDRELMLEHIFNRLDHEKRTSFFRLVTTRFSFLKRMMTGGKQGREFITCKSISLVDNASFLKSSKVTIDMPHISQSGLTIRSVEALAAHTKLVTTNADIVNYDFYHPDNILVISLDNPKIPDSFLDSPYHLVDEKIVQGYSIDSWVKKLFAGM